MLENILSRGFFIRLSVITSLIFYLFFILSLQQGWASLPENLFIRFLIFSSVPLLLISIYFTSYKKIFPQRLGDCLQALVAILIVIAGNALFAGEPSISGPFFIGFVLLIPFFLLLLDYFLPIFIGGSVSLLLIIEFLLKGAIISFYSFLDLALKLLVIFITALVCSSFVKRVLLEQTARKELQEAYEELEKLDKAKSEFISIASHQLRTPLTAIKGYISMMLEKTYGAPPEKMEKPLKNIYLSNERLLKLVNDLLNVSRIEAGRMEMQIEKTSLEEIITSVVEELKNTTKEKNIYLKWEKPEKPLPKISVDKEKIRQAIMNVVDNAIRYTEKGGVTIKIQNQKSKIQIIVKDTGAGLTKYELSKMFESFSRGAAGTRLYTEGVGLGLYVAKRFVEMHDGKIWAESKGKGKGSTFYIELPINR